MIPKELIDYVASKTNIYQKELLEKDLILHQLLKELNSNQLFKENFVFKGGTCLIKCYLGYYRFSEDLDFTWIDQNRFKQKSEKRIRELLSTEIGTLLELLKRISEKLSLDFKADKSNDKYVEFGGSNKFVTFKVWYTSQVLNR